MNKLCKDCLNCKVVKVVKNEEKRFIVKCTISNWSNSMGDEKEIEYVKGVNQIYFGSKHRWGNNNTCKIKDCGNIVSMEDEYELYKE